MAARIPTSWLARTRGLARMAGTLGVAVIRDRSATETLGALRDELSKMKGAVAKIGQMLSTIEGDLPPAIAEVFASLQDQTEPLPPSVIWDVVRRELKASPSELFEDWSPAPVASASIGQVHRARLKDGRDVAVKVQFPGVEQALVNDFRNLRGLKSLLKPFLPAANLDEIIAELEQRTVDECNYIAEASAQAEFKTLLAGEPGAHVPAVVAEFSTRRVLTSEFADGQRFAEFATSAPQEERDEAAVGIIRATYMPLFRHGIFQADPHPGNYLFRRRTSAASLRVTFLDFGCVKRLPAEMRAALTASVRASLSDDEAGWIEASRAFTEAPDATDADWHTLWTLNRDMCDPLFFNHGPARIDAAMAQKSRQLLFANLPLLKRFGMASDFVLFGRLQVGVGGLMSRLGACIDWRVAIEQVLP